MRSQSGKETGETTPDRKATQDTAAKPNSTNGQKDFVAHTLLSG